MGERRVISDDGELRDFASFTVTDQPLREELAVKEDGLAANETITRAERVKLMRIWEKKKPAVGMAREYMWLDDVVFCTNPLVDVKITGKNGHATVGYLGLTGRDFCRFEMEVEKVQDFDGVMRYISSPFDSEEFPAFNIDPTNFTNCNPLFFHGILRGHKTKFFDVEGCVESSRAVKITMFVGEDPVKMQAEYIDSETARKMHSDIQSRVDDQIRGKIDVINNRIENSADSQQLLAELGGGIGEIKEKKKRGFFGRVR